MKVEKKYSTYEKAIRFFIWILHLFNGHDENLTFCSNIYGDAIEGCNGKRSIWECPSCGRTILKDELHEVNEQNSNLFQNFKKILESKDFSSEDKENMFWVLVKECPEKTPEAMELLAKHDSEAGQRVSKVFLESYIDILKESDNQN